MPYWLSSSKNASKRQSASLGNEVTLSSVTEIPMSGIVEEGVQTNERDH
jgi:hypothetical protein